MSQNPIRKGRAKAARPSSRSLCPRPPLRSFTKEMGGSQTPFLVRPAKRLRQRTVRCGAAPCDPQDKEALQPQPVAEGLQADFFGASSVASALGIRSRRDPVADSVEHDVTRRTRTKLPPRPPLRTQRPRSPQACQRGASPRRILVTLGGLLTAIAKPTPPQRSWMSPLGVRPLADRFQTTTRRKCTARSVTFLRDPTTPVSVTSLNDLTGRRRRWRVCELPRSGYPRRSSESPGIQRRCGRL